MKRYLSYLSLFLCVVQVNATDLIDENKTFTPRQIVDTFGTMSLEDQQIFCTRIGEVRALIEKNLTPYQIHKEDLLSRKDTSDLLTFFNERPKDLKQLSQLEIYPINNQPLTLGNYLGFCLSLSPKREFKSMSSSYSDKDVQKILINLDLRHNANEKVVALARNLQNAFESPLALSPFNICGFSHDFTELKKMTQDSTNIKGSIIPPTYRDIAEALSEMTLADMHAFCQGVFSAKNHVQQVLLPYDAPGKRERGYYGNNEESALEKSKLILKAFQRYPNELKEVESYVLWNGPKKMLTLGSYLQFCVNMNPVGEEQLWIPFVQPHRWVHFEKILTSLNLRTDVQRDEKIQRLIQKVTVHTQNPLALTPLKIIQFSLELSELERSVETYQRPSFVFEEDIEKWILEHRNSIGASLWGVLSLAGYYYLY